MKASMLKEADKNTTSYFDSLISKERKKRHLPVPGWLKVAGVAALSAFAGGLAAAWWHRKTLAKLRESEEIPPNPDFGISGADPTDEI
jgi:hypothetical protein